ncbi:cysteine desulfurase [Citrobacter koseri]|uniref:Cysteine desulfurase n=1 Tax=Citrobacter koseri TaxID=545 RepID=A0A2X2VAH2_CITKO|nr:cysteine desulfurase [Citrobacter koseri]
MQNVQVENARAQVATVANADKNEVIFTSGATESNNIAILGMRAFAEKSGKKHIITSKIEHKAVLEPIAYLEQLGFSVTYLDVTPEGRVDTEHLKNIFKRRYDPCINNARQQRDRIHPAIR